MQWEDLAEAIQANLHPIVFVDAQFLPWADFMGFHAVVVDMIEATQIEVLDPADVSGPHQLSKDGFLLAWEEFVQRAAVISRS